MSDYGTRLRDVALAAWRGLPVATASGLPLETWSSTAFPHVFWGQGSFAGHRNLGRCPFVEMWLADPQSFGDESAGGGILTVQISGVVHVRTLPTWDDAEQQARAIALAGITACRASDEFGDSRQRLYAAEDSDFGLSLTFDLELTLDYSDSDFSVH